MQNKHNFFFLYGNPNVRGGGVKPVGPNSQLLPKICFEGFPNLMYIYHKQHEILQKNHWKSPNVQFQWFPIDARWIGPKRDQNYANAIAFFSNFSEVSRVCHQKADVQGFPMMWLFLLLKFVKPELWLVKVGSNLKTKNLWRGLVTKK